MRHALNVTPVNGHNTLFGFGLANQSMNAAAVPHLLVKPRPVQAAMGLAADGAGTRAVTGQGNAAMGLNVSGRCYLLVCGLARAALLVLDVMAEGRVIPAARGVAAMGMLAYARGTVAIRGLGNALGEIRTTARATIATRAIGTADLEMSGSAGIPHPKVTPATFSPAHPSRVMVVDAPVTTFDRADTSRTFMVPAETRTVHVSPGRGK